MKNRDRRNGTKEVFFFTMIGVWEQRNENTRAYGYRSNELTAMKHFKKTRLK
jgi:hypothetical protein